MLAEQIVGNESGELFGGEGWAEEYSKHIRDVAEEQGFAPKQILKDVQADIDFQLLNTVTEAKMDGERAIADSAVRMVQEIEEFILSVGKKL